MQIASIGTYRICYGICYGICRRICYRICHGTKPGRGVRASLNAKSGHFFRIGEFSRFSRGSLASCNANSTHVASKMLNFRRGCEQEGVHRLKETQPLRICSEKHPIFAGGASKTGSIETCLRLSASKRFFWGDKQTVAVFFSPQRGRIGAFCSVFRDLHD